MVANRLLDDGALGAHGMVVQIESISFMPGFALGMAASTLAGQYLGAQSKLGAAHAVRVCWLHGKPPPPRVGYNHQGIST